MKTENFKLLLSTLKGDHGTRKIFARIKFELAKPRRSKLNYRFIKKIKATNLLKVSDSLHLGSGSERIEGFINIDAVNLPSTDFTCSFNKLYNYFPENSISEIYICHALEHVSWRLLPFYLAQFYQILKKTGILRISVPDIEKITNIINRPNLTDEQLIRLQGIIGGGQNHKYNFHKSFFWPGYLKKELKSAGFLNIEEYPLRPHFTNQDINDGSLVGFDLFGEGVSLNMKAEK